jgi:ferric-dicitrate binding protein FerR (iron transport regulator)
MTNKQRLDNDRATADRREATDNLKEDNRNRNDKATTERRLQSDKDLGGNRDKNDEATANRKDAVDRKRNSGTTIALLLLAVIALEVVIIFNLI